MKQYTGAPVTYAEFCKETKKAKKSAEKQIFWWAVAAGFTMGMVWRNYHAHGVICGWDTSEGTRRAFAKEMGVQLLD